MTKRRPPDAKAQPAHEHRLPAAAGDAGGDWRLELADRIVAFTCSHTRRCDRAACRRSKTCRKAVACFGRDGRAGEPILSTRVAPEEPSDQAGA